MDVENPITNFYATDQPYVGNTPPNHDSANITPGLNTVPTDATIPDPHITTPSSNSCIKISTSNAFTASTESDADFDMADDDNNYMDEPSPAASLTPYPDSTTNVDTTDRTDAAIPAASSSTSPASNSLDSSPSPFSCRSVILISPLHIRLIQQLRYRSFARSISFETTCITPVATSIMDSTAGLRVRVRSPQHAYTLQQVNWLRFYQIKERITTSSGQPNSAPMISVVLTNVNSSATDDEIHHPISQHHVTITCIQERNPQGVYRGKLSVTLGSPAQRSRALSLRSIQARYAVTISINDYITKSQH